MDTVVAFTDSYLPTVNGVTYTVRTWRDRWRARGGRMDVVYPASTYAGSDGEHPVRSLAFPFYEGYRLGAPRTPRSVPEADVVHVHTPFSVGIAGYRWARETGAPLVASYHTPTREYTDYLAPHPRIADALGRVSEAWERWFLNRADLVVAPTAATARYLASEVGVESRVEVVSNGVDVERFRPVDTEAFRRRYDLQTEKPLVGYTGRHGYEKALSELLEAAAELPVTVVFGGDGPARADLERQAADLGVDVTFLGFLDREELPAFYASLDLFAFPSPVETEGIGALEAAACGTPVVGANAGALAETIEEGVMGYTYESGDIADFRATIERALEEREQLRERCLERRDAISVEHTVASLASLYDSLQ